YAHALPRRGADPKAGAERSYDGTAADAVEQLAASLLAELTPPWSSWLALEPAAGVTASEQRTLAPMLEDATRQVLAQFHRSNFAVELHQCFLDLACVGTATLALEEAPTGAQSAFVFTAVPAEDVYVEAGPGGRVRGHFRVNRLRGGELLQRYEPWRLGSDLAERLSREPERRFELVEAVLGEAQGHGYAAFLAAGGDDVVLLDQGHFQTSPFITFRWTKGAGDVYGRSPVMTALPDVKTANKVVELVLQNASMAITGMWQADDDGVLNPHNIRLRPGAVIPKAPGSSGLTPLETPGRFDVSDLILDDLRARIRHTLLVDRLGPVKDARMTATEVLERSSESARLLGAVYGRLYAELIDPVIRRALAILARRGEIPAAVLDRRVVEPRHQGPLARAQARDDVRHVLSWIEQTQRLGGDAAETIDVPAVARWLARTLGVPAELVRDGPSVADTVADAAAAIEALASASDE
ncbi:MAG TPA: portal protein, partial [Sandaracinaceae bacterium LLY-WYZ-13_1]|nr:portal protein [Sandaracinaceae bacterium LLY-WYZ-13_1]